MGLCSKKKPKEKLGLLYCCYFLGVYPLKTILRIRKFSGVTSKYSSALMYSIFSSKEKSTLGAIFIASSCTRFTHVCQLFSFNQVYSHFIRFRVFSNYLTNINLLIDINKKRPLSCKRFNA